MRNKSVVSLGEHDALKAALWKYGKRLTAYRRNADMTSWCDCGWDKIRETLSPPRSTNDASVKPCRA